MGPTGRLETSVTDCQSTLLNVPEERKSQREVSTEIAPLDTGDKSL